MFELLEHLKVSTNERRPSMDPVRSVYGYRYRHTVMQSKGDSSFAVPLFAEIFFDQGIKGFLFKVPIQLEHCDGTAPVLCELLSGQASLRNFLKIIGRCETS